MGRDSKWCVVILWDFTMTFTIIHSNAKKGTQLENRSVFCVRIM